MIKVYNYFSRENYIIKVFKEGELIGWDKSYNLGSFVMRKKKITRNKKRANKIALLIDALCQNKILLYIGFLSGDGKEYGYIATEKGYEILREMKADNIDRKRGLRDLYFSISSWIVSALTATLLLKEIIELFKYSNNA